MRPRILIFLALPLPGDNLCLIPSIKHMVGQPTPPQSDAPGYQDYILDVQTIAAGPKDVLGTGRLPISRKTFLAAETGTADIFTESMAAAMGWSGTGQLTGRAKKLDRDFLIISTQGGLRGDDGEAIALGAHTGHWELGLVAKEAARNLPGWGKSRFTCRWRTSATAAGRGSRKCSTACLTATMPPS